MSRITETEMPKTDAVSGELRSELTGKLTDGLTGAEAQNRADAGRPGRPELLAPAGSIEAMHAALKAGADAVYIGGSRFGARAYADNPDEPELLRAIDQVHLLGKRLYLTVNTLFKNREIDAELCSYLEPFYRQGLDGVIVQDPGVLRVLHEAFPGLELHASTQMAVTGPAGARLLQQKGVCRVVPARELSLQEIRKIFEETGLDIECFIHGAMCYSYSGMCLMSSLIGGRSGNRGRCAGVCRLPFSAGENSRKQRNKTDNTAYPLNMRDMCALELIPELIAAGCCSFKIEGRMKRPEYTAGVTSVYRDYIDRWAEDPDHYQVDPADLQRLASLFNRDGLCSGYYQMHNGPEMIALHNRKQEERAAKQHSAEAAAEYERIAAHLREIQLKTPCDAELVLRLHEPAELTLRTAVQPDRPDSDKTEQTVSISGPVAEPAAKQPTTRERIAQQLNKTGESPFAVRHLHISMPEEPVFLPVSRLNALRRDALTMLEDQILAAYRRERDTVSTYNSDKLSKNPVSPSGTEAQKQNPAAPADFGLQTQAAIQNPAGRQRILWIQTDRPETAGLVMQLAAEVFAEGQLPEGVDQIGIDLPVEAYRPERIRKCIRDGFRVRLSLPYVVRGRAAESLREKMDAIRNADHTEAVDGFLVRNLEGLGILKDLELEHLAAMDAGLFTWNNQALAFYRESGFFRNTVPLELNRSEIRHRDNRNAELVVYGRAPMMISAQCVRKTLGKCLFPKRKWPVELQTDLSASGGILTLTDRKGAAFPVVNYCSACYNVIYNSLPACIPGSWRKAAEEAGIASFRIAFTTEPEAQIREIMLAARDRMAGDLFTFPTTGGHYKRGVE
ncbi:MAG: DUF3656 domain-containing protein [Eubacterium sp.]|nr:DUF3656 domain-containing protein [Eubacterium sp.]